MQELLGHRDIRTTIIYTHVLQIGASGVRSPLEQFGPAELMTGVPQMSGVSLATVGVQEMYEHGRKGNHKCKLA